MRATPPDNPRAHWVRLTDIPKAVRTQAAHTWIRSHPNEPAEEGIALMLLALNPGPRAGGWVKP